MKKLDAHKPLCPKGLRSLRDSSEASEQKAINAKQVKVTFNKSVGTGATTPTNYAVQTVAGAVPNVVKDAIVTGPREVTLTLTSGYKVSTDLIVSVNNVYEKGSITSLFPKFSKVVNVNDAVAPEVTDVKALTSGSAAQDVQFTLSEPVDFSQAVFKVDGKNVTAAVSALNTAGTTSDATKFNISGLDLSTSKSHTFEVIKLVDHADNTNAYITKSFNVTQDTVVANGKASTLQDNKVVVTFDKPVVLSSLSNVDILYYDGANYTAIPAAKITTSLDSTGKVATFKVNDNAYSTTFFPTANNNTRSLIAKVKAGVVDTVGNQVKPFEEKVTVTKDTTAPKLSSIKADKNSKGEVTTLYFAYDENIGTVLPSATLGATDGSTLFTIKDLSTNGTVSTSTVDAIFSGATVSQPNANTVKVELASAATSKLTDGKFDVTTTAAALVKDDAFAQNANLADKATLDLGNVQSVVSVQSAIADAANKVTVTFNKPVTAETAKNPSNYLINGKALPTDTEIVVTDTTAVFTLPQDTVATTDTATVLTINNVKAQNSALTFKQYVGTVSAKDNTLPTVKGSVLSNGIAKLAFSEDLASGFNSLLDADLKADFSTVKVNGKIIDPAQYTFAPSADLDGKQVATLTVNARADLNVAGGGAFDYLYIDVDDDGVYNAENDILLDKSSSDKTGTWNATTNTADLTKVSTVQVITSASPSKVVDKSTLGTGNTLAENTTIVIK